MGLSLPLALERMLALLPERTWATHLASSGLEAHAGTSARWIVRLAQVDGAVEISGRRSRERRDERFVQRLETEADLEAFAPELREALVWWAERLTVHSLVPGQVYRVGKGFRDHTGREFVAGEELSYVEKHFLPYDGGHTIVFTGDGGAARNVYLQEEAQGDILEDFDAYFVEKSSAPPSTPRSSPDTAMKPPACKLGP
jgi:hypothetical protein